jgi:succinyl-diaminopimelate desuccinylase
MSTLYEQLDQTIDAHFDEQVRFLQELIWIPTDTPPGNNAPHAERTAELLGQLGLACERFPVPAEEVQAAGLTAITNLIAKVEFGRGGKTIALNAHGDVVPPGEGWSVDPYGAIIQDGKLYGRAAAVSKSDFSTFTFATRALQSVLAQTGAKAAGRVELQFTYDEEFGGELGPGYLLRHQFTKPDLIIAAGFSYQVVTAHNGCLQMEVTVHGEMAHAAVPETGVDALQATHALLGVLYAENVRYKSVLSKVEGIRHPYLNVGLIQGGTNTNVVPGKVVFKLDRRMIPEENSGEVEAHLRGLIESTTTKLQSRFPGLRVEVRRLILAESMKPLPGNAPLVQAIQKHGQTVFGEPIPAVGTPLYTDVRLYAAQGIPGVIYGAGPRTILESHAKRSDERLDLEDLRKATKVIARTLADLLVEETK